MFDTVDRIVNLDIGKRGVDKLYGPARARCDEPDHRHRPAVKSATSAMLFAKPSPPVRRLAQATV